MIWSSSWAPRTAAETLVGVYHWTHEPAPYQFMVHWTKHALLALHSNTSDYLFYCTRKQEKAHFGVICMIPTALEKSGRIDIEFFHPTPRVSRSREIVTLLKHSMEMTEKSKSMSVSLCVLSHYTHYIWDHDSWMTRVQSMSRTP